MPGMRAALYIAGAIFELFGIVLVASPDLFPQAARVSRWIADRSGELRDALLQMIGRGKLQTHPVGASVAMPYDIEGWTKSPVPDATLEENVGYLLERVEAIQHVLTAFGGRIAVLERDLPRRVSAVRSEMDARLRAALSAYLPLRLVGIAALILGLALSTAGNLVR